MILKVTYKLTALFLTFALLANNISNVVIVTDFLVNQDFIAKTLCIQKEDQKGCNGKCQLKKELVQNNTDSNSNTPLQVNSKTSLDVFIASTETNFTPTETIEIVSLKNTIHYRLKQPHSGFYAIVTPPPNLS